MPMTDIKDQYIETTNLYWEMLWKAQKIEDKKLMALLHQRLQGLACQSQRPSAKRLVCFSGRKLQKQKRSSPLTVAVATGCLAPGLNTTNPKATEATRIIPFPVLQEQAAQVAAAMFWPAQPAIRALACVASYCLFICTGILTNLA
jgi:hypothetical protein